MTAEPGTGLGALGEQRRRRRAHADEPALAHLEDADLARRAEAVLHGAHDAERVVAVALEVQHRVDHVLEHARPGDRTVLGDVTDDERRDAEVLGDAHQPRRARAHLADAAGRTGELGVERGLDRVDDEHAGLALAHRRLDARDVELGQQRDALATPPRAARPAARPAAATPRRTRRARRAPAAPSASAACSSSVDLPIPGSPPSSTSDPPTSPPPSTRSSSAIPVDSRAAPRWRPTASSPSGAALARAARR